MPDHVPPAAAFDPTEPGVRLIAASGLVIVVLLIAVILGLQAYYDRVHEQEIFVKQLEPVSDDLKALHAREDADLASYHYIDRAKGAVRLPISRAMELLVKEADGKR